uniref:(northern house mosquito) hypothetical protein n=1 Tax=Culex pipiens TaxID=7175 RepID=A0A8D8HCG3_CULPI
MVFHFRVALSLRVPIKSSDDAVDVTNQQNKFRRVNFLKFSAEGDRFLNVGHCWIRNIQDSPNFGRNRSQSSSRESTRQKNHELPLFQIMYLHGRPVEEPVDNQRNRETKVDKQQSSWKVSVDISG